MKDGDLGTIGKKTKKKFAAVLLLDVGPQNELCRVTVLLPLLFIEVNEGKMS